MRSTAAWIRRLLLPGLQKLPDHDFHRHVQRITLSLEHFPVRSPDRVGSKNFVAIIPDHRPRGRIRDCKFSTCWQIHSWDTHAKKPDSITGIPEPVRKNQ